MFSESSPTSKMEPFGKIIKNFLRLTIFAKSSILDVWQGSEYASGIFSLSWMSRFAIALIAKSSNRLHKEVS